MKALLLSPRASVDSIYARAYGAIVPACTNKTRQEKPVTDVLSCFLFCLNKPVLVTTKNASNVLAFLFIGL
ncbi:hypothetical protein P4S72_25760 [Vibrio sp. PP-XX7]